MTTIRFTLAAVLLVSACSRSGEPGDDGGAKRDAAGELWSPHTDGTPDGMICGEAAFSITRTIPEMLIVLDRSNSMGAGTPPLWDQCRGALTALTAAMEAQIAFGLLAFPGPLCTGGNDLAKDCSAPTAPTVPVGTGAAAAIKAALASMKVCGGTPTAQTLMAARDYLGKLPAGNHARHILLATDGGPDCNPGLDLKSCTCTPGGSCVVPENCLDDARTYKVLDDLCAAGIKTYVVGLGPLQLQVGVLKAMAQHGCSGAPYAPSDAAAIQKTFTTIAAGVATCAFELDCSKIPDPGLVNFYFDGKRVPRVISHASGWDWVVPCQGKNTGKVEFFGPDCDAIKTSQVKTVTAKFGCATKIEID